MSSVSRSLFAELPPFCALPFTKLLEGWAVCPPDSLRELQVPLSWNVAWSLSHLHSRWTPLRVCAWVCMLVCGCSISWNRKHEFKLKKKKETLSKSEKYRLGSVVVYSYWLLIVTNPLCSCEVVELDQGPWGSLCALCILLRN